MRSASRRLADAVKAKVGGTVPRAADELESTDHGEPGGTREDTGSLADLRAASRAAASSVVCPCMRPPIAKTSSAAERGDACGRRRGQRTRQPSASIVRRRHGREFNTSKSASRGRRPPPRRSWTSSAWSCTFPFACGRQSGRQRRLRCVRGPRNSTVSPGVSISRPARLRPVHVGGRWSVANRSGRLDRDDRKTERSSRTVADVRAAASRYVSGRARRGGEDAFDGGSYGRPAGTRDVSVDRERAAAPRRNVTRDGRLGRTDGSRSHPADVSDFAIARSIAVPEHSTAASGRDRHERMVVVRRRRRRLPVVIALAAPCAGGATRLDRLICELRGERHVRENIRDARRRDGGACPHSRWWSAACFRARGRPKIGIKMVVAGLLPPRSASSPTCTAADGGIVVTPAPSCAAR